MGIAHSACNYWQQRLGWGGVPDTQRATYFSDALLLGAYELLACPSAMGCSIVQFEQGDPSGGQQEYKVQLRLSHSEYVPRYQLHAVKDGRARQWIVGHMEKSETHLYARPGEFMSVQVWKLICNQMVMEEYHGAARCPLTRAAPRQPTPSPSGMRMMGMTVCTQAKIDCHYDEHGIPGALDGSTERWVQTIGVEDPMYMLNVEPPRSSAYVAQGGHKSMQSLSVMRIVWTGKKVCVARKQRFAGAVGPVEQPYLGVQILPDGDSQERDSHFAGDDADQEGAMPKSLLDTQQLMLLLLCLAWSEETMSPDLGMRERFVEAMRKDADSPGSASDLGLSEDWDLQEVKKRLKHVPYFAFHDWRKDAQACCRGFSTQTTGSMPLGSFSLGLESGTVATLFGRTSEEQIEV